MCRTLYFHAQISFRFRVAPQPHRQLFRGCVKFRPRVAQPAALFFKHPAKRLEMSSTFSSPVPITAGRRKAAVASLGSSWICFRHPSEGGTGGGRGGALGAATAATAEQQPAVSDNLSEEEDEVGREGAVVTSDVGCRARRGRRQRRPGQTTCGGGGVSE